MAGDMCLGTRWSASQAAGGLPEDLGQNPFCQLSRAAKYCHDPSVCGDLKHDILQHKGTSVKLPSFVPPKGRCGGRLFSAWLPAAQPHMTTSD